MLLLSLTRWSALTMKLGQPDRAEKGGAILMPVQLELVRIEEASRVDQIIANVIEDVAVVLIRARPQDHVHDAPGHAADLRGVTGDLHLEFLHGAHVGANLRGGPARIAGAEAVHIVVGGAGPRAGDVQARALS